MIISDIIEDKEIESTLISILNDIHVKGPINPAHFETLALIKASLRFVHTIRE